MRTIMTALMSIALMAGMAGTADAAKRGNSRGEARYYGYTPSDTAARQHDARTFDETQYYERLSEKIPFGTSAWWRQREREGARDGG
jgi:hypothetical protein